MQRLSVHWTLPLGWSLLLAAVECRLDVTTRLDVATRLLHDIVSQVVSQQVRDDRLDSATF